MAQLTETKTQNTVEASLAHLLTALKSSGLSGTSVTSGFASLLQETNASLVKNEKNMAPASVVSKPFVAKTDKAAVQRDWADASIQTQTNDQPTAQPRAKQEVKPSKKTSSTEPSKDTAVAADKTEVKQDEQKKTKAVAVADVKKDVPVQAMKEEISGDKEEAAIQALIAVLAPLVEEPTTGVDGDASKAEMEAQTSTEDMSALAVQDAALRGLRKLQAIQQQIKEAGGDDKSGKETLSAENLTQILNQIAKEIAAVKGDVADDLDSSLTVSEEISPLESLLSAVKASSDEGRRQGKAGADEWIKSLQQQAQNGTQSQIQQPIGLAQNVAANTMGDKAQFAQQSGEEALKMGSGSSSSNASATQNLAAGGGLKTSGSYDFASQLSAVRVTHGGAAGLPQAVEQVAVQLHKAVKDGLDQITVQLRPAELGKIEIKLEFGADKSVKGTVIADNQATLTLLQKDADSLQRALQGAGLLADNGCLSFSLRDGSGQGQFANGQNGNAAGNGLSSDDAATTDIAAFEEDVTAIERYYITPGRVNIHV